MVWSKKITKRMSNCDDDIGIKVACWNKGGALQPLKDKVNEIENLIKTNNFGVFGVTEANFFREDDIKDVEISGYSFFWDKGRENAIRKNSRCCLYVRNDLNCKIREDLMKDTTPEIWMEIGEPRKRRSLLCVYYREFSEWNQRMWTNSIKCQTERLEEWLETVEEQLEKELWLIGDFNFDLNRKDDNSYSRKSLSQLAFQELIGRGMTQMIEMYTLFLSL